MHPQYIYIFPWVILQSSEDRTMDFPNFSEETQDHKY